MTEWTQKIRKSFDQAGPSYDAFASVQRQSAEFLVNQILKIQNFQPKSILDLGTGTGLMPKLLLPHYPQAFYTLNDLSDGMIEHCKTQFKGFTNIQTLQGDLRFLDVPSFDLIVSNFAFQWIDPIWTVLEAFYAKSEGVFAFSTLVKGTFHEWEQLVQKYHPVQFNDYPTEAELTQFCHELKGPHQFFHWARTASLTFDSPIFAIRYLKALGASATPHSMPPKALKRLLKEAQNPITLSYHIFFGIFQKGI